MIVDVDIDIDRHGPDCFITQKELGRRAVGSPKTGKTYSQTVHIHPTRPSGVADAMEIALPLTPKSILFLGPRVAEHARRTW
jgi:hypothetical protein